MTNDDIDLDERLVNGLNHIPSTMKTYAVYLKKFAIFVQAEEYELGGALTPKAYFTDENIAKFILALHDNFNHRPHILKSAMAAIGHAIKTHLLPNIHDFKHLYGKTHNVIQVSLSL